jgi:hypothetical protein
MDSSAPRRLRMLVPVDTAKCRQDFRCQPHMTSGGDVLTFSARLT